MKAAVQCMAKSAPKGRRVVFKQLPPSISTSSIPTRASTTTATTTAAATMHTSSWRSSSFVLTRPLSLYALSRSSSGGGRAVERAQRRRPRPPTIATSSSLSLLLRPSSSPPPLLFSSSSSTTRSIMTQSSPLQRPRTTTAPLLPPPRRHFWSPRFLRQLGLPWFAQAFYGTIFLIGIGVLAISVFATSTVFAVLFLVAFAGFKLLNRQPHLLRQVLRPKPGSPPSFFGPLVEMMGDGMLLDGLKNAREAVERDVLGAINMHPRLGKWGTDFRTTGLHKMNMRVLNGGEKHVVMEMVVVSSMQREMLVQVVASRQENYEEEAGGEEEASRGGEQWIYENVSVQTPDGAILDLTDELVGGKAGKHIVIDVEPRRVVKKEETRDEEWKGRMVFKKK